MARLGRFFLADQPLHVIQRGNDRQAIFFRPTTMPSIAPCWGKRPGITAAPSMPMCS